MLTEWMQVLLTSEQRSRLERVAAREKRSIAVVTRDAVDRYTMSRRSSRSRDDALAALCALEAPVDDWEVMKAQITGGVQG